MTSLPNSLKTAERKLSDAAYALEVVRDDFDNGRCTEKALFNAQNGYNKAEDEVVRLRNS